MTKQTSFSLICREPLYAKLIESIGIPIVSIKNDIFKIINKMFGD